MGPSSERLRLRGCRPHRRAAARGRLRGQRRRAESRMANPYLFRLDDPGPHCSTRQGDQGPSAAIAGARQAGLRRTQRRPRTPPGEARHGSAGQGCAAARGGSHPMRRIRDGWEVFPGEERLAFDGVVLAALAPASAGLLRTSAPFAAVQLQSVDYASVAIVTLAYRSAAATPADDQWLPGPSDRGSPHQRASLARPNGTGWLWLPRPRLETA